MKHTGKKSSDHPRFMTELPPHLLQKFLMNRQRRIAADIAHRVEYPDKQTLHQLTAEDIERLGFAGHHPGSWIGGIPEADAEPGTARDRLIRRKKLPDPFVVASEVQEAIAAAGLKPVGTTGNLVWGEQNLEFGTRSKIRYFDDSYRCIIPLAHIWLLSEVSNAAAVELGRLTGYRSFFRGKQPTASHVYPLAPPSSSRRQCPVHRYHQYSRHSRFAPGSACPPKGYDLGQRVLCLRRASQINAGRRAGHQSHPLPAVRHSFPDTPGSRNHRRRLEL